MLSELTLMINETFYSIQGESTLVGHPTFFIRTTGCNIRCAYCDTKYSYFEGTRMSVSELLKRVERHKVRYVCITGGEPMAQKNVLPLMSSLCDLGYIVSLETNGHFELGQVDRRVIKIVDVKTPGSGEKESFNFKNLGFLLPHDQVKFVICSDDDYQWARSFILQHKLSDRCTILMSPSFEEMSNKDLAEKILKDSLPVRLQIQMHKYIWNPSTRGV